MDLKIKRLSDKAVMPVRAHEGDAGLDLTCTNITSEVNECGQLILVYHTDLAVEIPEGYVGLLFPRSSIYKKSLIQTNCVGVIDASYRGELMVKFKATTDVIPAIYNVGDRFTQLVIVPYIAPVVTETTELSSTDRGTGGYGSSDNKDISADTGSQNVETAPDQAAEPSGSESAE